MEPYPFNPQMLTLAREAKGMTQSAFAGLVGIGQAKVSKVEEGLSVPNPLELDQWARLLGQDPSLFHFPGPANLASLSFYRKTSALPLKVFKSCNAQMNLQRISILKRLGDRSLPSTLPLPYIPVADEAEAAAAAKEVRKLWRIPRGPVGNLTRLVESAGCLVINFDFGTDRIDGLAIGGGTSTPFIFLNRDFPPDRRRLSLAHELAHLVMHRDLKESVEAEAWAFAAEFLLPEAEIKDELYPLSIERLANLKLKWHVSMQAILQRARKLNKVQERYSRYLWMRLGQYGYRKHEPYGDQIPHEPVTPLEERMNQ